MKRLKRFGLFLFGVVIMLGVAYWYTFAREVSLEDRFDKATQRYAFVLPEVKKVKGLAGFTAENCKACHTKEYEEWKESTHSNALSDIQFQAELTKESSPKWVCLNCHIPIQNQREYVLKGFKAGFEGGNIYLPLKDENPRFDVKMQKEAITCAVCHVRTQGDGEGYIIGPYGSKKAPHPVKKDKRFLQDICYRCHSPKGKGITENLVCWFRTKEELDLGQKSLVKSYGSEQNCVSCHMPEEKRLLVPFMKNLKPRKARQHNWVGGGIPKWYHNYDNLLKRGYKSALGVNVSDIKHEGEEVKVKVLLKNEKAGHYLPTADPERMILVYARLLDASNKELYKAEYKIWQHWEWSPARKVSDNRLAQGEVREWEPSLKLERAKSRQEGLKIQIKAIHVRLSSKNAKYMIEAKGVNEKHFPKGQYYVKNAINYYPMASYVYMEEIDLKSGKSKKVYTMEELIELSKKEKGKPLSEREY